MARNKRTSKRLATISARILHVGYEPNHSEIRSMAASLLTQSPDRDMIVLKVKQEKTAKKTGKKRQ